MGMGYTRRVHLRIKDPDGMWHSLCGRVRVQDGQVLENPGYGEWYTHFTQHLVEDMEYITNHLWPDESLCPYCQAHEDFPFYMMAELP